MAGARRECVLGGGDDGGGGEQEYVGDFLMMGILWVGHFCWKSGQLDSIISRNQLSSRS